MKIRVIYGLLLIKLILRASCEAIQLSNSKILKPNNELNELVGEKKNEKNLKSSQSIKKSSTKQNILENSGITTTKPKKKDKKNRLLRGKTYSKFFKKLAKKAGLKKKKKSKDKTAIKKSNKDKTIENETKNSAKDSSGGLNKLVYPNKPSVTEPVRPPPNKEKQQLGKPSEDNHKLIKEPKVDSTKNLYENGKEEGTNSKKIGSDNLLGLTNKVGEKTNKLSDGSKRTPQKSSFLNVKEYDNLLDGTFNLEDALGPPEPEDKTPIEKPGGLDLMDLISKTPKKKLDDDPKGTTSTKVGSEEPLNPKEPKNPKDPGAVEDTSSLKKKKKSDKSDELDKLFNGSLDDLKDKFKTVRDGIADAIKKPGAMDKLKDTLGLGDHREASKEDTPKKPSKKSTDDNLENIFNMDSDDDEDDEEEEEEKGHKKKSGKRPKSKTKMEDIKQAHKTEYREKLVDSSFDKEFKQFMGDGEFGSAINYYKGHEIAGDKTSGTKNIEFYNPRDPSVDWNNSGLAASLRYLGSGYDIVFGNPLGDPVVMMDQGYRNPVIKLNWDVEYMNSDGANLKEPHGSWVRPEFSCRQSETIDHINSVEDFKKELSVDAQASYGIPYFFSFSGSTGYKNFVKSTASNKVRTYITKTYCLRYVAGIVNYHEMDTTDEFKKAVSDLPNYFDSQACTLELFKSNEDDPMCVNSVKPWVKFIKMFGTHFTTIVHLGGKITHQVQINKSDVLNMQQHGVNVDIAVKAAISPSLLDNLNAGVKNESERARRSANEHFKYEKQVLVIGGDGLVDSKDLNSLNCWTKDLYKKPMPIKIKLESIKSLLSNDKQRESFEEALKFYSETYGVSPDEIYKKYGREFGVASLVQKGHQIVYSGNKSGSAVCPNKTVIIMGFSMTILKKKNFIGKNEFIISIAHCPVGEEKCLVSNDNPMSESRIWAVCGEDTIPLLNQQTSVKLDEPATASCPSGYSIAYGFAFSIPKGNKTLATDSYPCRAGTVSCTHESADKSATNAVWIACVENGAPQLTDISNHMVSTSSRNCSTKSKENEYNDNVCPTNSKLIAGWSIDFSETEHSFNYINKCSKATTGCKVDKKMATENKCRSHYSWISCLNESKKE